MKKIILFLSLSIVPGIVWAAEKEQSPQRAHTAAEIRTLKLAKVAAKKRRAPKIIKLQNIMLQKCDQLAAPLREKAKHTFLNNPLFIEIRSQFPNTLRQIVMDYCYSPSECLIVSHGILGPRKPGFANGTSKTPQYYLKFQDPVQKAIVEIRNKTFKIRPSRDCYEPNTEGFASLTGVARKTLKPTNYEFDNGLTEQCYLISRENDACLYIDPNELKKSAWWSNNAPRSLHPYYYFAEINPDGVYSLLCYALNVPEKHDYDLLKLFAQNPQSFIAAPTKTSTDSVKNDGKGSDRGDSKNNAADGSDNDDKEDS